MRVTFAELWNHIESEKARKSPLMTSGGEDRVIDVVRSGKELRGDDDSPFWEEFISLCNNADGLAQLFGVSAEKVRTWPGKIHEALDKLERHTATDPGQKEKAELVPTGDNGAFSVNQDPTNIGDVS